MRTPEEVKRQLADYYAMVSEVDHQIGRILDALDNAGAKATFFVQGAMAVACPDIVRDAVRRGHRVGNHGFLHHSARAVPFSTYLADILKCQSVLQDILGSDVGLDFRPPYGHLTPRTLWAMARNGFRTVFWSIDSRDSFILESGKLVQSIAGTRLRAAEVMLFHDDYAHTAEALPAVLSNLKARGCALSPLQSPQPSAAEGRARSGGIA